MSINLNTTWIPTYLQDMRTYFANPLAYMYGRWNHPASDMEGGVDLASPGGTPVYALATGPIMGVGDFWHGGGNCLYQGGAGCTPGYGVVTTRINVPGYGLQDLYYQHIDLAQGLQVGQIVQRGQEIGTINPNVGELEMGFNANWGGVWGTNHPGPWATDPRPMLQALMTGSPPPNYSSATGGSGPFSIGNMPSMAQVTNFTQRFALAFMGGLIILIGVLVLFFSSKPGKEATSTAEKAAVMA